MALILGSSRVRAFLCYYTSIVDLIDVIDLHVALPEMVEVLPFGLDVLAWKDVCLRITWIDSE